MAADKPTRRDLPAACADCADGWREVALHIRRPDRLTVRTFLAACRCELGKVRHGAELRFKSVASLDEVLNRWGGQHGVEVFYTSAEHPALTDDERMHPDSLARMRERRQAAVEGGTWRGASDRGEP